MTQTIAPYAAPPAAVPTAAPAPVHRTGLRGALSRTPGRLRVAGVVAVLAAAAVGVVGLNAGLAQSQALSRRATRTPRSSSASRTSATTSWSPTRRRRTRSSSAAWSRPSSAPGTTRPSRPPRTGSPQLAGSNAADAELLGQATAGLTTYTGLVEQARANNRQGFPVGAAYLDQASAVLRSDVLPQLDELVQANSDRVDASFDSVGSVPWLLALGILALAALVVVQVWLARRTHRRLNAGPVLVDGPRARRDDRREPFVLGSTAQRAADVAQRPVRRDGVGLAARTRWPTTRSRRSRSR